jgi:hypothetical protein
MGSMFGYKGDGKDLPPGATLFRSLMERLGPLKDVALKDWMSKKAPVSTPTTITFSPAMIAAKKMEKKIKDQLEESSADKASAWCCI